MIDEIEMKLLNWNSVEIPSREIGKMIMEKLKGIDPMAYVRFASVYLDLDSIDEFKKLLVDFKQK
jgi:transcriptional repressor NrdR